MPGGAGILSGQVAARGVAHMPMTREELQERHTELHRSLDELLACFIETTGRNLSTTNLVEFLEWANRMRENPLCHGQSEEAQKSAGHGQEES